MPLRVGGPGDLEVLRRGSGFESQNHPMTGEHKGSINHPARQAVTERVGGRPEAQRCITACAIFQTGGCLIGDDESAGRSADDIGWTRQS